MDLTLLYFTKNNITFPNFILVLLCAPLLYYIRDALTLTKRNRREGKNILEYSNNYKRLSTHKKKISCLSLSILFLLFRCVRVDYWISCVFIADKIICLTG
ncbi:hypothetical protein AABB24_015656 [Solanum stoloniferum]|uniref:Uncharacterized protein n=1 Tax=Solanum stoloniferum TaxID=62892 RepID=A0ABD2TQT9_9SOLN